MLDISKKKALVIVGISGASGSGKSSLASEIVQGIGSDSACVISEDSYYKDLSHIAPEQRQQTNFDHPSSLEHALLIQHIISLKKGEAVNVPIYDYITGTRLQETTRITECKVLVLEGIMLFQDPKLRELMDIRIFIDAPLDLCLIRRLRRDVVERGRDIEAGIEQYKSTTREMFMQFIEPSKKYADILVPKGGKNRVAIDIIRAKLNEHVN